MRQRIGLLILAVASVAAIIAGAWAGRGILYVDQVQLLRELREVSTIIFGIMGAWSAIVYPEQLKRTLLATEAAQVEPTTLERFRMLMHCIVLSATIVAVILLMQFAAPIIGQFSWARRNCVILRSASFAIACLLGVVQIWVVLLMLVPINAADADVRTVQQTQRKLSSGPQGKKGTRKK
jgi:hypothetical protein